MTTPCTIAIQQGYTIKLIVCYRDGRPSHNSRILLDHYTTEEQVLKLIELGDLSVLDVSPEYKEGHSFVNQLPGLCVAYIRDRGECVHLNKAKVYAHEPSEKDTPYVREKFTSYYWAMRDHGQGYNYLFKDGEWYMNGLRLKDEIINY